MHSIVGAGQGTGGELLGGGGTFESEVFRLGADGHGSIRAAGPMRVRSRYGMVDGGPGTIGW